MSTTTTPSTTTTIASLPVEIHAQILRSLPCFRDVHHAILTSRLFHNAWVTGQNGIINTIARETIQPLEALVRLYLARQQQKFEVSVDGAANYRLTLHTMTYICEYIREAETQYKAMLSNPSPRTSCALELDLFTTTYLAMKLIEAYPANLLGPLLSRTLAMDLLRIRQLQKHMHARSPPKDGDGGGGGDRGGLVQREFMARLPRGSAIWEAMAERMIGGEPLALWREGQEQVREFERAMKDGMFPWDTGASGAWEAGGVEGFTGVQTAGGGGWVMGFYRYV
ncbi:hypothetical protein HOY80DRAFT_1012412 [Tuber brumale]|nr:hypothetical protein HOY80DRAFT_1012412 [Tuber brumale]